MSQRAEKSNARNWLRRGLSLGPGAMLCGAITAVSLGVQTLQEHFYSHLYVESLVIAILLGMIVRSAWQPSGRWVPGIAFSAKQMLEVAVMLLGASISLEALVATGPLLIATIVATVVIMLAVSFGFGRLLGLSTNLSILIACGNSICGNSAIAAVAPVIEADSDDIASSISFTAVLGVLVVLALPLLIPLLGLSATQYGILAGLTVYAVPQVLAATVPAGIVSTQIGTVVKLVRVLMLGPLVIVLSVVEASRRKRRAPGTKSAPVKQTIFVPWFIAGFLALSALRSFRLIPDFTIAPVTTIASMLTVVSMAALGLGVDIRVLSKVGSRVTAAVTLSLLLLLGLSIGLVQLFE